MAQADRPSMSIVAAQINQSEAQLALAQDKLARRRWWRRSTASSSLAT
jgi:hypothetical protein